MEVRQMKAEFPSGGATGSRLLDTKKSKQAPKIPHGSSADTKLFLTRDSQRGPENRSRPDWVGRLLAPAVSQVNESANINPKNH